MDPTGTDSTTAPAGGTVSIPPGVTVSPGRETSQINAAGQVVQGVLYPITLGNGTTSSVFIPETALQNPSQIEQLFAAKINALQAIPVG